MYKRILCRLSSSCSGGWLVGLLDHPCQVNSVLIHLTCHLQNLVFPLIYLYDKGRFEPVEYNSGRLGASEAVTLHVDPVLRDILRAEALAAQKSVSALLREWIDERLDLPVRA